MSCSCSGSCAEASAASSASASLPPTAAVPSPLPAPLSLPARFSDPDDDVPQEECGIFGVYSQLDNAAITTFFALHALQHRGQEMAGIACYDGVGINTHKGLGLVSQIFIEDHMKGLQGRLGVGHTRYSTAGGKSLNNAQPFVMETDIGKVAVAHNGQLTRQKWLRKLLLARGTGLFTSSDSEVLAQMLAHPSSGNRAASPPPPSPGPISPSRHRYQHAHGSPSHAHTHAAHHLQPHQHPSPSHHHNPLQHPRPVTPNVHYQSALTRSPSHDDTSIAYDGLVQIHQRSSMLELEEQKGGQRRDDWQRRLIDLMSDAEGAYALVVLVPGAVYGCRDRYGIRPLCLGEKKTADGSSSWALSSESCGFGPIGFTYVREIAAGEIVRLNAKGVTSLTALPYQASIRPALCIFEYVYFARPDTLLENQLVHTVRQRFGRRLAAESPVSADIVAGVPDSSIAAAIGYSMQSGLPFMEVLCKNRYIGRTFIQPEQAMRENSIRLKFNPLAANLAGKRIVLVDDSLVRGNTLKQLIPLLKLAGAVEVHIRISSPVLRHPCYMGVDIGTYDEILATHMPDVGSMAAYIGADSLQFLSYPGMIAAVKEGLPGRQNGAVDGDAEAHSGHCTACFTGEYPVALDIEDEARSMNRGHC